MIPFHNAMSIASGVSGGPARAEFDAHIATLGSPVTWSDTMREGASYFTCDSFYGLAAYGTTWRPADGGFGYYGPFNTGAAHAFPDSATRALQIGRRVFCRTIIIFDTEIEVSGHARNGVTTSSGSVPYTLGMTQFIFFDDASGIAYTVNPSLASPVFAPYTWTP